MGLELLFLLLPVAALSGWLIGRRPGPAPGHQRGCELPVDYFRGLNFLLNEQPDKAIEVFMHMVEIDSDTVELHFTLAQLFRRRGEVDRAIRIHQNLIARPVLSPGHRNLALYELGRDYMSAGLLDRAESLFHEIAGDKTHGPAALRQLLDIYQQEKEWHKAIDAAGRLQDRTQESLSPMVAQYWCELAESATAKGEYKEAEGYLAKALAVDRRCVRASLLEGQLALKAGNHKAAIKPLRQVSEQDPAFLPETLQPLAKCYSALGKDEELGLYLQGILNNKAGISAAIALAEVKQRTEGEKVALDFLVESVTRRPSLKGLRKLLELRAADSAAPTHGELLQFKELLERLMRDKAGYRCGQCGFAAKRLHWQCPSCKQWNTVRPLEEAVDGV